MVLKQWTNIDPCRLELDLQKIIFRAEDLVLAEERTTEADKELIMEGENIPICQIVMERRCVGALTWG